MFNALDQQPGALKVLSRVNLGEPHECWVWLGAQTDVGGPRARLNCETICGRKAVRGLLTGDYGDGRRSIACPHSRLCVNPDHTGLTLDDSTKLAIVDAVVSGKRQTDVAAEFKVSRETVNKIFNGTYDGSLSWDHLTVKRAAGKALRV